MTATQAALLLLADGRFPAGSYAHSGGLEPLVVAGLVSNVDELELFVRGRVMTVGAVAATFAAAACAAAPRHDRARVLSLDVALDARTPSPALRAVSRQLGRQLLRAASAVHPHRLLALCDLAPHQPVALGVVAASFGLCPRDAAVASLHEGAAGPATAGVRLLSLDPFAAHAILARLAPLLGELADRAECDADGDVSSLPSHSAPLMDVAAEHHAIAGGRLFAS